MESCSLTNEYKRYFFPSNALKTMGSGSPVKISLSFEIHFNRPLIEYVRYNYDPDGNKCVFFGIQVYFKKLFQPNFSVVHTNVFLKVSVNCYVTAVNYFASDLSYIHKVRSWLFGKDWCCMPSSTLICYSLEIKWYFACNKKYLIM